MKNRGDNYQIFVSTLTDHFSRIFTKNIKIKLKLTDNFLNP